MNLSLLNWLEVQRLFWHSHWTDTARLGAVIPPTGSPGGQSICPRRGGSAFPWGQSTSVQWYPRHTYSAAPSASPLVFLMNSCCCFCASLRRFLLRGQPSGDKIALPAPVLGKECAGELLAGVWGICRIWYLAGEPLSPRPGELPLCALTSVWVALLTCAGVTESLSFSTPSSALCPPDSVSLLSLERTFAAGRTRRDWSCPRVHSRSWACCWGHGYGVPEHAPCRCQASSPLSWTGWWSFWSVLSSCWCQCWNVALSYLWHRPLWQTGCCLKPSVQQGSNPFLISVAGHFFSGRVLHCPHWVQRWPAGSSRRLTAESVASWLKSVLKYSRAGFRSLCRK